MAIHFAGHYGHIHYRIFYGSPGHSPAAHRRGQAGPSEQGNRESTRGLARPARRVTAAEISSKTNSAALELAWNVTSRRSGDAFSRLRRDCQTTPRALGIS